MTQKVRVISGSFFITAFTRRALPVGADDVGCIAAAVMSNLAIACSYTL
ncbi:hypothetical protein KZZ52_26110 [Dactylosporangium sp. AC04546]|nr:hypothetical protein [Dactylosporangium sp. AC04546]WVK88746.1 hypothetical protein KZZ52_26110 [Dactylosporangium sp. AC04546]